MKYLKTFEDMTIHGYEPEYTSDSTYGSTKELDDTKLKIIILDLSQLSKDEEKAFIIDLNNTLIDWSASLMNSGKILLIEIRLDDKYDEKEILDDLLNEYPKIKIVEASKKMINAELLHAAKKGDIEGVKKACDAGADVNHQDERGNTALIYIADYGLKYVGVEAETKEIIDYLMSCGADPQLKNRNNLSAYDLVLQLQKELGISFTC